MFKKLLTVTLVATMALSMVGCSSKVKVGEGEVKLAEYKGLVVYADDIACTDEEYESVKESFLQQNITTELNTEGKIKKNSVVNVDYVGKIEVNGEMVAFDGGTSTEPIDIDIANDKEGFFDGFVDSLIGHEAGEEFTAHLQFPETYGGSTTVNGESIALAGMPVDFTFTVHGIQKDIIPEFTDKLVKEKSGMDDVTTMKEFEEFVRNNTRSSKIINAIWADYLESCEVITYDEKEMEAVEAPYESAAAQNNASLEDYIKACGWTQEQYDEMIETSVKNRMIIKAIAKKEKLLPNDEEYESEATELASQYGLDLETFETYNGGKDVVELNIIAQKVQDFIIENVKEKEGSAPTTKAEETTEAK